MFHTGQQGTLRNIFLRHTTLGYLDASEVLLAEADLDSHEEFYSLPDLPMQEERRLSWWDLGHYLPNDILTKVDRATMAVGLEARAPFLARPLVEFAFALPAVDVSRKTLLKEVLARYVPRPLFDRPKQGFEVPLGEWLRGPLRAWASDLLSPDFLKRQGLFQVERLQQLWREQLEGADHNHLLWVVLMFQLWALETGIQG
ncbi:MAG: asparagine synthase C-terminal domain-containing protein [Vulcanimicrobiota bacterium]